MTAATRGMTMARAQSLSTLADGAAVAIPGLDALTRSRSAGSQSGVDGFWLKGVER
jgi:hypothetical protein